MSAPNQQVLRNFGCPKTKKIRPRTKHTTPHLDRKYICQVTRRRMMMYGGERPKWPRATCLCAATGFVCVCTFTNKKNYRKFRAEDEIVKCCDGIMWPPNWVDSITIFHLLSKHIVHMFFQLTRICVRNKNRIFFIFKTNLS